MTRSRRDSRWALALGLTVLGGGCAVLAAVVRQLALERSAGVDEATWTALVIAVTWPAAGLVLLRSDLSNRCGWIMVAAGAVGPYQLIGEYTVWNHHVAALPAAVLTDWISSFGFVVYLLVVPLAVLYFPDGRLPSPQWRRWVQVLVGSALLVAAARMFVPGPVDIDPAVQNPLGVPGFGWLIVIVGVGALLNNIVGLVVGMVGAALRSRRAVGTDRRRLQWLLVAGVAMLAAIVVGYLTGGQLGYNLAMLGPPLAAVAGLRPLRRVDVDLVLRRVIVLTIVLAVVGVGGTVLLVRLEPDVAASWSGLLVLAGLAVAASVLAGLGQRVVDAWWFPRQRAGDLDPAAVMARATTAGSLDDALVELLDATRRALRSPSVALVGPRTVVSGAPLGAPLGDAAHSRSLEVVAFGATIGRLDVVPRRGAVGFSRPERLLLERVAEQVGLLSHALDLVAEVDASRARAITTREEERRRLRNDLHDGVGPSLAAIALQADALRLRLDEPARTTATRVRDHLRTAVQEVRCVSRDLRPPVLDQIGLHASLVGLLGRRAPVGSRLDGAIELLDALPASTEVALLGVVESVVTEAASARPGPVTVSVQGRVGPDREVVVRIRTSHPAGLVATASARTAAADAGGRLDESGGEVVVTLPTTDSDEGGHRDAERVPVGGGR